MSFYDLATELSQIREDGAASSGATTISSITYLPTQVGAVRSALQGLRKKKGQWNLEILEDGEGRTVRFEDALEIKVANDHWDAFQGIFDGVLDTNTYLELSTVALKDSLEESEESLIENRMLEVRQIVEGSIQNTAIQKASDAVLRWFHTFGGSEQVDVQDGCLIPLPLHEKSVECLVESLTEDCQDDLGQLDILLCKMKDLKSLRECDFLAGVRIPCQHEGIDLVFEAHTTWDNKNHFSVFVGDDEIADAVEEAMSGVHRIQNVFYPRGGQMVRGEDSGFIRTLLETIQDVCTGDTNDEQNS